MSQKGRQMFLFYIYRLQKELTVKKEVTLSHVKCCKVHMLWYPMYRSIISHRVSFTMSMEMNASCV